jgi:hypothetical protein
MTKARILIEKSIHPVFNAQEMDQKELIRLLDSHLLLLPLALSLATASS